MVPQEEMEIWIWKWNILQFLVGSYFNFFKIVFRPSSSAKICILCVIRPSPFAPSYAFTAHVVSGPAQLLTSWVLTLARNAMCAFDLNEKFLQKQGVSEVTGFPALSAYCSGLHSYHQASRPGPQEQVDRASCQQKVTAPQIPWGFARFVQA